MNNENDIIVTASDHAELSSVINLTGKVSQRVKWELRLLENELKRARIVAPEEVPPDVITINTRAEFLDLETGERMEFTVVLPTDAKINEGKISVLEALGTAMLGYRVGETGIKTAAVRRLILDYLLTEDALPAIHGLGYMREWGLASEPTRKLKLQWVISNLMHEKWSMGEYDKAVTEWK